MLVARKGGTASSSVLLSVSDDGIGLKDAGKSGFGMRIMRQRAALLGANINFISEEGNGCMVCVELTENKQ
jgi:two-component system NarL family sensor kinase